MEVVIRQCPSPGFGEFYHSAPTSPTRLDAFYQEMLKEMGSSDFSSSPTATVPFKWEEKPGTPKSSYKSQDDEFAFDVSEETENSSLSAQELFDSGLIRPINLPPNLQHQENQIKGTRNKSMERGRSPSLIPSSSRHRATRSLSPFRVSEFQFQEDKHVNDTKNDSKPTFITTTSYVSMNYKKWSLKSLFLFRSASEGRAADKYPIKKYAGLFKEANKQSSFRSVEGAGVKKKGPVSAHELHYKMNRAVSEDLKKKTLLPYKQGILGMLSFNPAVFSRR